LWIKMNGHLFAAEQIHAKAHPNEVSWVCLHCRMRLVSCIWYPDKYPRDRRVPDCFPLTSCAEYKKAQAAKVVSLEQWKVVHGR
jgi:hypothetical protein